MKTYYIGADAHKQTTTIAVRQNKKIIDLQTIPTKIEPIMEILSQYSGRKIMAIEESSLSTWLNCHLHDKVNQFISSDPRRNRLICDDGDKADPIDATKLTELLANNSLRPIHHSTNQQHIDLKQWTALYHDRIKDNCRQQLKLQACSLQHGIHLPSDFIKHPDQRKIYLQKLENRSLANQLLLLSQGLDVTSQQVAQSRKQLQKYARKFPIIQKWQKLPGIPNRLIDVVWF